MRGTNTESEDETKKREKNLASSACTYLLLGEKRDRRTFNEVVTSDATIDATSYDAIIVTNEMIRRLDVARKRYFSNSIVLQGLPQVSTFTKGIRVG